jgi:hypothetical protein
MKRILKPFIIMIGIIIYHLIFFLNLNIVDFFSANYFHKFYSDLIIRRDNYFDVKRAMLIYNFIIISSGILSALISGFIIGYFSKSILCAVLVPLGAAIFISFWTTYPFPEKFFSDLLSYSREPNLYFDFIFAGVSGYLGKKVGIKNCYRRIIAVS